MGYFQSTTGNHSFLLDGGTCSAYCSFDFPGSIGTYAFSINDAGQIVGDYLDVSDQCHGFLYYRGNGGNFYSIDYPGGTCTEANGVNGDGTIVGESVNATGYSFGFMEYAQPPSWGGTFATVNYPGAVDTAATGINSDAQISGWYVGSGPGAQMSGFEFSYGVLLYAIPVPRGREHFLGVYQRLWAGIGDLLCRKRYDRRLLCGSTLVVGMSVGPKMRHRPEIQ